MTTRDVGDVFMYIIQLLAQGVSFCFSFLNSITFLGTSLLNYFVAITILSALFPVIFSVVRSRSGSSRSGRRGSSDSDD